MNHNVPFPPEFPWLLMGFPAAIAIALAYGYLMTGKFFGLLMPDSIDKIGNETTRKLAFDVLAKLANLKKSFSVMPTIHTEIKGGQVLFEHQFAKFHEVTVKDVANAWINNKDSNIGISFSFAVQFFVQEAKNALSHLPEYGNYESSIYRSIAHICSQYDWEARA